MTRWLNAGGADGRPVGPTVRLAVTALEDRLTPATLHWLGSAAAGGNLWSVPANWAEGRAPVGGDRLAFDTTAVGFSATANGFAPSNDVAGLSDMTLAIQDSSAAGDFALAGTAIGLTSAAGVGVTSTVSAGAAAVVNIGLTLGAATTVGVGLGTLTLGGPVGGGFALTAAGSPAGTLALNAANTYTGGTVLTSGTVSVNTNTSLGAGAITFNGGTLRDAASFLALANPFVVAAPSTVAGGGFFELDGDGTLNATLTLAHTGFLALNGALSGPGGLSETGFPGGTTLGGAGPNTFTGGTAIVYGGLTLLKTADGASALSSPVTLTGSFATLTLGAKNQLNGSAVALGLGSRFSTNGFAEKVTSLTGLGTLDTGTVAGAGLTVTGGGNRLFAGPVTGSGLLAYTGTGALTLAGPSASYSGTLTVTRGSLVVAADFSGAAARATGGTLGGTGVVKSIAAAGGFVDAATPGTGGTLTTAANAVPSSLTGATFRADLGARGPSDHLALGAAATLDLTGAGLAVNPLGPTFADSYYLVTSQTGGLSGAFNALPNGATLTAGGQTFRIDYAPTAVTLTNLGVGSRSRHWTGAVGSNWSSAGNWAENAAPASGDTLVFDTSTPGFAGTAAAFAPANDIGGLTDLALVLNDASTAGDFTLGGNLLGLTATSEVAVSSTVSAGAAATITNALRLAAATTVGVGLGTLILGGPVGGGFALTAAGSPAGTLVLNAANTYSGGTVVASGTVSVGADRSLGSGTLTLSGGTLANAVAFLHVANPFVVAAPSTIGGGSFFDLDGSGVLNADLRLTNTGFLVLNGAVSGAGGLIEDGFPGSTTLSGPSANTYTGLTTVLSGTLALKKSPGVVAVASPVSLAGGSFPTLSLEASGQLRAGVSVALGVGSSFQTGGFNATVAGLSGIGGLDTGTTAAAGLTVASAGPLLFTGPVTGSGLVTAAGPGPLTLGGTSPMYTGQLVAAGGALLVAADFSGATAATRGGTLGGTGVVKSFPAPGTGAFSPGGTGVAGVFTTAPGGSLASTLSGQTFLVDLDAAALSDQLVVGDAATVALANATLGVNLVHSTFRTVFTIVASPTGGVSGTFTGLPDDATFPAAGRQFRIHYTAFAVTLTDLQSVTLTPGTLPVGEAGVAYDRTITSTGGTAPVTLAVSGVTNATGLTISGSGTGTITLSGTPTSAGTVTFTVTPADALGPQAGTAYSVTVNPPVVLTPSALPAGEVGLGYNQAVAFTGGTAPVALTVSGVTNATGLTIAGSGTGTITVSGTPTAAGTVTFTVTPSDPLGTGTSVVYSFAVNPAVVLNPAALPAGEVGVAYTQAITFGGGTAPVTLTVSAVTNATGLTISGSGTGTITVSGRPTSAGTVTFTVTPADPAGTGTGTVYTFDIVPGVVVSPTALPPGEVGLTYARAITGSGGAGPITLTVSGVTNATGLTVAGSGTGTITVSGTPTAAGAVTFTVTPADAVGTGLGTTYTVAVSPAVALSPAALPVGEVGLAYNRTISPAGGVAPATLIVSGVTNATGLTIAGTGTSAVRVTGTPTSAGPVAFTVTATDALGGQAVTVYSFAVGPPVVLSPAALPAGEVGVAYSRTISSTGGTAPVTLTVSGVTNATGLTIAGSGTGTITVSGTPTAAGAVTFTVTPTDPAGTGAGTVYTIPVAAPPINLVGSTRFAVGSDAGGPSAVTAYRADGSAEGTSDPFPGFTGGVRTAAADFTGDGVPDVVAGTGPGGPTHVRVLDGKDGRELFALDPFEARFTGGVFVAVGDLTGDGVPDLVVSPDEGGGPRVRVFDGRTFAQVADFFGIDDPAFRGGARAGVGDVTGDGVGDLVVAAGFGGGPRVAVFDGTSLAGGAFTRKPFPDFFAFEDALRNGVYVAAGDLDGDGRAELIAGGGPGGGPRVSAFGGAALALGVQTRVADFFAGGSSGRGGARVAVKNLDGDGRADLVVGAGAGDGSRVVAYTGKAVVASGTPVELFAFDAVPDFRGGVYVG